MRVPTESCAEVVEVSLGFFVRSLRGVPLFLLLFTACFGGFAGLFLALLALLLLHLCYSLSFESLPLSPSAVVSL
jgi:ABC-type amino acid transport system permease subunit